MKEIKFRAKTLEGWLAYFTLYEVMSYYPGDGVFYIRGGFAGIACEVGTEQQYTGSLDKQGKEIYEGDIVKRDNRTYPSEVYWDDRDFSFRLRVKGEMQFDKTMLLTFAKFSEIIGNIYENPELLEIKDEHSL